MSYGFRFLKKILRLLFSAAAGYVFFCIFIYLVQDKMIYFPTPEKTACIGQPVVINMEGVDIKGTVVNPDREVALIYYGGNGEQIEENAPDFSRFIDVTTYLINYRGYGGSGGKTREREVLNDAKAVFDMVRENHTHVAVMGYSLGTAVATYIASRRDVCKVILVAPFDGIEQIAMERFPFLPIRLIVTQKYRAADYANSVSAPVTVIYTPDDEIISAVRTGKVIDAFHTPPVVYELSGFCHNSLFQHPDYWNIIGNALDFSVTYGNND